MHTVAKTGPENDPSFVIPILIGCFNVYKSRIGNEKRKTIKIKLLLMFSKGKLCVEGNSWLWQWELMNGSKVGDTATRKPIWPRCNREAASQCPGESSVRRTNISSCHLLFLWSYWDFSCSHLSNSSEKPSLLAYHLADAAVSKCLSLFPLLCFCSEHQIYPHLSPERSISFSLYIAAPADRT